MYKHSNAAPLVSAVSIIVYRTRKRGHLGQEMKNEIIVESENLVFEL